MAVAGAHGERPSCNTIPRPSDLIHSSLSWAALWCCSAQKTHCLIFYTYSHSKWVGVWYEKRRIDGGSKSQNPVLKAQQSRGQPVRGSTSRNMRSERGHIESPSEQSQWGKQETSQEALDSVRYSYKGGKSTCYIWKAISCPDQMRWWATLELRFSVSPACQQREKQPTGRRLLHIASLLSLQTKEHHYAVHGKGGKRLEQVYSEGAVCVTSSLGPLWPDSTNQ